MCLNDYLCPPRVLLSAGVKRSLTGTAINPIKILHRLVSLKFFLLVCKSVQPRSWIRAVTLDLRCSCLLRNVQQLYEFCLIYRRHIACMDPIQDNSIPKVTEPMKNIQSLLILRDIPLNFSSRNPVWNSPYSQFWICSMFSLMLTPN